MGIIATSPGAPGTVSSASGGKIYGFNNISESGLVIVAPANPARQRITFHNPGTHDVFVAPTAIQTTGSDVTFNPSAASLGGCFRVYGNGGNLVIEGECQKSWQAFVNTGDGTTNPLTVMDDNV